MDAPNNDTCFDMGYSTYEQAFEEGIGKMLVGCEYYKYVVLNNGKWLDFNTPREAYAVLIDKISGKGTWDRNPIVFAYDFKLVK